MYKTIKDINLWKKSKFKHQKLIQDFCSWGNPWFLSSEFVIIDLFHAIFHTVIKTAKITVKIPYNREHSHMVRQIYLNVSPQKLITNLKWHDYRLTENGKKQGNFENWFCTGIDKAGIYRRKHQINCNY